MADSKENYSCGKNEICIDVAGDVTPSADVKTNKGRFDNYLHNLENMCGLDAAQAASYPFFEVKKFFDQSYTIVNFETSALHDDVLSDEGKKYLQMLYHSDKSFHFTASEYATSSVYPKNSSVEAATLANNHFRDLGTMGMQTSMELLSHAGITYFGAGENYEEAHSPKIDKYKGKKIALIGASALTFGDKPKDGAQMAEFNKENPELKIFLKSAIEKAKKAGAEIIIVYFHWGVEKDAAPQQYQIDLAHYSADLGANLVVGSHQHVIQGVEEYTPSGKKKMVPIAYGLGNFMFGGNMNSGDKRSIIFRLKYKVDKNGKLSPASYVIVPVITSKNSDVDSKHQNIEECFNGAGRYQPKIAEGDAAKEILDLVAERSLLINGKKQKVKKLHRAKRKNLQ